MLGPDISCFENNVDPDQLASRKSTDQDPHCFLPACKYCRLIRSKLGNIVEHTNIQHDKCYETPTYVNLSQFHL